MDFRSLDQMDGSDQALLDEPYRPFYFRPFYKIFGVKPVLVKQ
jgi:hypothetical protein